MVCLAILLLEVWVCELFGKRRSVRDAIYVPNIVPSTVEEDARGGTNRILLVAIVVLIASAVFSHLVGERKEIHPARLAFVNFPTVLGEWHSTQSSLPENIQGALKLTDYLLADYEKPSASPINYYVAYYASQRKGASPHSPEGCIPGGGWVISSLKTVPVVLPGRPPFDVNRAVIDRGGSHLVVYYWFDERGRQMANEYLAKWYLLVDSLFRDRTDGALVRITLQREPGEPVADVDRRATAFMKVALPPLSKFVPD